MKSEALVAAPLSARLLDYVALTKPRLNSLVILTAGVGYYLGARGPLDQWRMLHAVVGTTLVAGAAAALNQVAERDTDARMLRTRLRPLPDGRLQLLEARVFGLALGLIGLLQLLIFTSRVAALVALATLVTYTAIYTPLKRKTSLAMMIGAVPGALPVVVGWAAATGAVGLEAATLFGVVFLWQIPHFLAIAWLYREDFARAELPFLPVVEPAGHRTARYVIASAAALIPVSLAPTAVGLGSPIYGAAAAVLGTAFLLVAWRFACDRTVANARFLFVVSIAYLPLLWGLLVTEHLVGR